MRVSCGWTHTWIILRMCVRAVTVVDEVLDEGRQLGEGAKALVTLAGPP
jgi:hypothetical protein